MNDLEKNIEALLFVSGDGMSISKISEILNKKEEEIEDSLKLLKNHLEENHFLSVLRDGDKAGIVTSSRVSRIVEDFAKEEFSGELTKAASETLAVVAYKAPIKRSEIDYIRGVNSSFMLRNLLVRGLVERLRDPKDSRSYVYRISADFLKFLGLTSISDLPDYGSFAQKLEEFVKEQITN
ncbi:MAG: SMC-Scp complex subunit ScpB [Patescibacteria group bacterium]